jgi:hypothetical protein
VSRRDAILRAPATTVAAVALALVAGCGGGERQDAGETSANYPVAVQEASFPAHQRLAQRSELRIAVRNAGSRTIPNLAVTIEAAGLGTEVTAFGRLAGESGLATRSRPVWIVDSGPGGGDTAYANTWALGPLPPHRTKRFTWKVAAVRSGHYKLTYRLAGSLTGGSAVRQEDGDVVGGSFEVDVTRAPAEVRVTRDGRFVDEPAD